MGDLFPQDDGLCDHQQGGQFKEFLSDLVACYAFQGQQLTRCCHLFEQRPQDDILFKVMCLSDPFL